MSPLFLVGCGLIVAAVMLGASGAPAGVWVLAGALGLLLVGRGATTTPKRRIRSHSAAKQRARAAGRSAATRPAKRGGGSGGGSGAGGSGKARGTRGGAPASRARRKHR